MKKTILLFAAQILLGISASADANAITLWEDAIPLHADTAIEMINEKASEMSYRDDDTGYVCGGETANYQLSDYFTEEAYDGLVTHNVYIKFQVTVPVDYCAAEAIRTCEVKFAVTSEDDVQLARWSCENGWL